MPVPHRHSVFTTQAWMASRSAGAKRDNMILSRLAACLYIDAARYGDAADASERLLKSDMSCLVDWSNAICADLMAIGTASFARGQVNAKKIGHTFTRFGAES